MIWNNAELFNVEAIETKPNGSSITHGACAAFFTNSYTAHTAKLLGADVLCKGMGSSCYCEEAVAEYLPESRTGIWRFWSWR